MQVQQIQQPGQGCPGFLGVPIPVMSPGVLCPDSPCEHYESEKGQSHIAKPVSVLKQFFLRSEHSPKRKYKRRSQHSIGKHIHTDVRYEPGALESRHQGLVVNLWLEAIDDDEYGREHRRKG